MKIKVMCDCVFALKLIKYTTSANLVIHKKYNIFLDFCWKER